MAKFLDIIRNKKIKGYSLEDKAERIIRLLNAKKIIKFEVEVERSGERPARNWVIGRI